MVKSHSHFSYTNKILGIATDCSLSREMAAAQGIVTVAQENPTAKRINVNLFGL